MCMEASSERPLIPSFRYRALTVDDAKQLLVLHWCYKQENGEDAPDGAQCECLLKAMEECRITFYGCFDEERLVGMCAVRCGSV